VNKASFALITASEVLLLSLLILFATALIGSNVSLLAWILQLTIVTAAILNCWFIMDTLAGHGAGGRIEDG